MSAAPVAPNSPEHRARVASSLAAGAAVLLAASAYYLRFGYSFGDADHDDLLPELLRRLDPSLYPNDAFVSDRAAGVSVRGVFVAALHALSLALPVPVAVALLHVVTFAAVAHGVFSLSRELLPRLPLASLAAPAAVLAVFSLWTLGENSLAYPYLVPEGLAWALVVPAMVGVARRRVVFPAVLVALAAWVHSVTGLIVGFALAVTIASEFIRGPSDERRRALARAATFAGVFAIVCAPVVLPLLLGQSGENARLAPTGYDLFVRFRLPHHLLPTAYPLGAWVRFGLLAGAGGLSLAWLGRQGLLERGDFVGRFLFVTVSLCLVAAVGIVGFESLAVARAQAFKLTVPAAAILVIGLCGAVAAAGRRLPGALGKAIEATERAPVALFLAALVVACVVLAMAAAGVGRPGALYRPRAHAASDAGRVEAWARRHTPVDALFVVPPATTSFRVGGRRGAFVTWKAHPFRSDRMRAWLRDLQTIAPVPIDFERPTGWSHLGRAENAYCVNRPLDWERIAEASRADYAIVADGCGPPAGRPAFRAGSLAVYALATP